MRAGLDLQPHRVALAAVVQFHADGLKQRPRLFLLEIEVGVARHAERRRSKHLVAAIHAGQVLRDQVLQQQVIVTAIARGQPHKARQRARHRHHAQHLRAGAAPLGPQQQRQAESLVQHARKRMRRVDRDRRQQRIDLALKIAAGKFARVLAELVPFQQTNALLAQLRQQVIVPAAVLRGHKAVNLGSELGKRLFGAQAVVAGLAVSVLDALHQPGLADFDVLVEIRPRDGEKLHALQQRIRWVFSLLQHAPVELHPGVVPAIEKRLFLGSSGHDSSLRRVCSLLRFRGKRNVKSPVATKMPVRQKIQHRGGRRYEGLAKRHL